MLTKDQLQPGKSYRAISPNGHEITGRFERVQCNCRIDSFSVYEGIDALQPEFAGESDMFWDGQEPEKDMNEEDIYFCSEMEQWSESELRFEEVAE